MPPKFLDYGGPWNASFSWFPSLNRFGSVVLWMAHNLYYQAVHMDNRIQLAIPGLKCGSLGYS